MAHVSLKELARELNLSVSTVSRALNDSSDIAQHTKDRARALAAKLKYEPNPYASSLRNHKSKTIGVVIPDVNNHFFSLAIDGIEEIARANNYHVLISLTHEDSRQEIATIKMLAVGRVDGLLISTTSSESNHLIELKERGIPLVFFDRVNEKVATAKVTTDDYRSAYKATTHLLDIGCRTILHLTIAGQLSISKRRLQGYTDALRDKGITYEDALVLPAQAHESDNTAMIQSILQTRRDIDGIFASVEMLAMSSYEACQNLQLSIPDDIKIIGFSNLETVSLLAPPLTTVTQPAYSIGKEAARLLFQAVNKNKRFSIEDNLEIESSLIIRESTMVIS